MRLVPTRSQMAAQAAMRPQQFALLVGAIQQALAQQKSGETVDPCMARCTGGELSKMGECWVKCRGISARFAPGTRPAPTRAPAPQANPFATIFSPALYQYPFAPYLWPSTAFGGYGTSILA